MAEKDYCLRCKKNKKKPGDKRYCQECVDFNDRVDYDRMGRNRGQRDLP